MQEDARTRSRQRWRPRFTVAGLLWLTFMVAVMVTAYRYGVEVGRIDAWRAARLGGPHIYQGVLRS